MAAAAEDQGLLALSTIATAAEDARSTAPEGAEAAPEDPLGPVSREEPDRYRTQPSLAESGHRRAAEAEVVELQRVGHRVAR